MGFVVLTAGTRLLGFISEFFYKRYQVALLLGGGVMS